MAVGMKKALLLLALGLAACSQAAWYWPFGYDEDNTNRPPRLHRLLEKANDFIELAEDETAKGEADKALDLYRQALDELYRVQVENPERAEKPEFAPLRNKIATCRAAVDAIRFEQINANVRAVSVTDTTELQRKWNKKHGIKDPDLPAKKPASAVSAAAEGHLPPAVWREKIRLATELLSAGDAAAAEKVLDELAKEQPTDLNLLLVRAAAQASGGRLYAARKTLEQASKAHPESYMPHYNLAYVALQLGEGRKVAREHYEQGRELGGPANKDLEARLSE